jgi:membrane fusion protein (multidrug efflux system)
MYLNITQSATELQNLRKNAGSNTASVPVTVLMEDGTEYPRKGKLLFSDMSVDPTTGQVTLRAQVDNPDNQLLPGQYVRVRLSQAELPAGILVPQQAVTRSNQGDTLMVVSADGKIAPRTITIGSQKGSNWVVLSGLKEGENVMVDGFQKLQMLPPGTPVKPVKWTPPAAPAPGAAPAAANAPAAAAAPATASR